MKHLSYVKKYPLVAIWYEISPSSKKRRRIHMNKIIFFLFQMDSGLMFFKIILKNILK